MTRAADAARRLCTAARIERMIEPAACLRRERHDHAAGIADLLDDVIDNNMNGQNEDKEVRALWLLVGPWRK